MHGSARVLMSWRFVSPQLYRAVLRENGTLKDKLQETELLLSQNKVELERLRQVSRSIPPPLGNNTGSL